METYCSENITELAKALLNVQQQMSPATKDAVNPFIKNKYATLNSVMESCRDALLANGIWLTQLPVPSPAELGNGYIALMTKLTHAESGQWQSSITVAPLPKADPQGMGSAITYARRYALTAMLGIVTEDDDGEAAKLPPKANSRQMPPQPSQNTRVTRSRQFQKSVSKEAENNMENLPSLDGVTYQYTTTSDDRQCIIATGNTHASRDILRNAGFHWDGQRKFWWKYADAS